MQSCLCIPLCKEPSALVARGARKRMTRRENGKEGEGREGGVIEGWRCGKR